MGREGGGLATQAVGAHAGRWLPAAGMTLAAGWLLLRGVTSHADDATAVGLGMAFLARGAALGRTLHRRNVVVAAMLLLGTLVAARAGFGDVSRLLVIASGFALARPAPPSPPGDPTQRRLVEQLVARTPHDPLAAFAQRTDKSYVFDPAARAAVAYRVRFGTAVASGDPVGDPGAADEAMDAFLTLAAERSWRVAVLGTARPGRWEGVGGRAVPIGRDVVLDVARFAMVGRRFRNLRQAVQRTRNCGVTTAVVAEADLSADQRDELMMFMRATRGVNPRGFSMILDHPLEGAHPGTVLAMARDRDGRLVAVHRFATSDGGREVSLDLPWRAADAPNGVDERLAVDTVAWAREHGGLRVSLAFAGFADLFARPGGTWPTRAARSGVRLLDGFISLGPLYRYLRKFHAFDARRYVVFVPAQIVWVGLAMLTLEFARAHSPRRS